VIFDERGNQQAKLGSDPARNAFPQGWWYQHFEFFNGLQTSNATNRDTMPRHAGIS
jgi:hypothetical protein